MPKIKRKLCKSYREFNKILRKYSKYLTKLSYLSHERFNIFWLLWIQYYAIGLEELNELKKSKQYRTERVLREIVNEVIDNYGKEFRQGKLIGFNETNEDYYYVYERSDGSRRCGSCCGGLDQ